MSVVSKVCRHVQMHADYSHDTNETFKFEPNIFLINMYGFGFV